MRITPLAVIASIGSRRSTTSPTAVPGGVALPGVCCAFASDQTPASPINAPSASARAAIA